MSSSNDISKKELILERLRRNGVVTPFSSVDECVYNLVGIQSQVQQFAEVAIMNRCAPTPTMRQLEKEYAAHRVVNLWGQRKTLHMYTTDDASLICDLYHDRAYMEKYLEVQHDLVAENSRRVRERLLDNKVMSKEEFQALVNAQEHEAIPKDWPLVYIYQSYLSVNGVFFGVPAKPSIKHYSSNAALGLPEWQADQARLPESLDSAMLRYFTYYGPASMQDFCHWSGLPAGLAKEAFERLESRLTKVDFKGRPYYCIGPVERKDTQKISLLGKFDPLFVSYKHKDWVVPSDKEGHIWRSAGHVEAVVFSGASPIGTWRHTLKGKSMTINVEPFKSVSPAIKDRIHSKAQKLARFWQKDLVEVAYV